MTETPKDMIEKNDSDKLSKVESKQQQEEEKYELYRRVYLGQLSEEEESNRVRVLRLQLLCLKTKMFMNFKI